MRALVLIFIGVFFSYFEILSQDLIYPEIEKELSNEQKEVFDKAVLILQKASGNENNADAIDWKYKNKRNSTKWELKTWEAKEQRIIAERNYQSAYSMISEVYSSIITKSIYRTEAEKQKALSLNESAKEQHKSAAEILSKHKDISKLTMANTNYELLIASLEKSHNLKLNGIRDQISALDIYRVGIEKEADEEDLAAWEKAENINTVSAYHEYLNNNPRGKYMSKANDKIRALEKRTNDIAYNKKTNSNYNPRRNHDRKNAKNNKNLNNSNTDNIKNNETKLNKTNANTYSTKLSNSKLIFKVQIAASKSVISDWTLMHKAPGADLIEEYRTSTWIKYMVGKFGTYHEAAKYRDKLRSTAPDAFIVVFEKGKPIAVTEQMKL